MEVHYYHVHEVWHALYNRAEEQHLRDPENKEVKDEDARRRQLDTHEGIMDMTFKDLRNRVANTAEFDASLRQAYSKPSRPIQAHEHFVVTLVQQKVRRQQQRTRKKEHEEVLKNKNADEYKTPARVFAHQLLQKKKEADAQATNYRLGKRKANGMSSPERLVSAGGNQKIGELMQPSMISPTCLCTLSIV
jgi:hypothetical protein